jgi:septum formation protein
MLTTWSNQVAPELILASTSVWRRQMLAAVGVRARAVAPGVREDLTVDGNPVKLACALASAKAKAVQRRHPNAWVLGADQVACDALDRSEIWGKPLDPTDHLARLMAMRGQTHLLITGWTLLTPDGASADSCETRLTVRGDLTDDELRAYVATGEGSGCAAGYMAEGRGAFLFERIDGDWHNVLGLPVLDVMSVLRELGWRFDEG